LVDYGTHSHKDHHSAEPEHHHLSLAMNQTHRLRRYNNEQKIAALNLVLECRSEVV
jgi:hypothetical protein